MRGGSAHLFLIRRTALNLLTVLSQRSRRKDRSYYSYTGMLAGNPSAISTSTTLPAPPHSLSSAHSPSHS